MNKKGEENQIALMVTVAVVIIVGALILTSAFGFIGTATNTVSATNATFTTSATANVSVAITGQELIGTPFVQNRTGAFTVDIDGDDANMTVTECIDPVSSLKRVCITGKNAEWVSHAVNITYTYGPEGYIDSSGGRSIAGLIAIFGALAVAVIALLPTFRSKVLDLMS